ncbi:hypothetical protein ETAE_3150 [Edwardsiella piscicida]|uniref:Uncharacterized protein n=1 Tax=Edwardsiella piscicida TaxID=1263550 RepID=A0AAU8PQR4_EDWPI|nr:hypothetical protein ETAE_3150 [Edwardsiella tarda EIB202]
MHFLKLFFYNQYVESKRLKSAPAYFLQSYCDCHAGKTVCPSENAAFIRNYSLFYAS